MSAAWSHLGGLEAGVRRRSVPGGPSRPSPGSARGFARGVASSLPERLRRFGRSDLERRRVRPETPAKIAEIDAIRPVPIEAHLAETGEIGDEQADRPSDQSGRALMRASPRSPWLPSSGSARSVQRRRAGHVPGAAEGIVGRIEQGDHRAAAIGDIGEIVRQVGGADVIGGFALGERAKAIVAEHGQVYARAIKIGRANGGDFHPAGLAGAHARYASPPSAPPA